jgi:hypothetical protein
MQFIWKGQQGKVLAQVVTIGQLNVCDGGDTCADNLIQQLITPYLKTAEQSSSYHFPLSFELSSPSTDFDTLDSIGAILQKQGTELGLDMEWRYSAVGEFMGTVDGGREYPSYRGDFSGGRVIGRSGMERG